MGNTRDDLCFLVTHITAVDEAGSSLESRIIIFSLNRWGQRFENILSSLVYQAQDMAMMSLVESPCKRYSCGVRSVNFLPRDQYFQQLKASMTSFFQVSSQRNQTWLFGYRPSPYFITLTHLSHPSVNSPKFLIYLISFMLQCYSRCLGRSCGHFRKAPRSGLFHLTRCSTAACCMLEILNKLIACINKILHP